MTAPRSYLIGLPVTVTVHDDGTVTYDIDVSEAADAPSEWDPDTMFMYDENGEPMDVDDDLIVADTARIEAALERPGWTKTPDR